MLAHLVVSLRRSTPNYFPDEYIYSALGRSLAETGQPSIRGQLVNFPSLLQPLVTAPFWLVGDVQTSFRIISVLGAITMSLAAIPVYWLARRLSVSGPMALAAAALTLATPSMLYSSWLLSEPLAYPLFTLSFAAGVLALAGERRWLAPALALLAALTLCRIQLVVFPLALALSALFLAAKEHRLMRFLRRYVIALAAALLLLVLALALPDKLLGFYSGVRDIGLRPSDAAAALGTQTLGLFFAAGWIILPGAVLGLAALIGRPHSKLELAFASTTAAFTIGVVAQAALVSEPNEIHERYLFYATGPLALAFALLVQRGWPLRRAHALLSLPVLLLVAIVPLSTYTSPDRIVHSSFLFAVFRLQRSHGVASVSLALALIVSALMLTALIGSLRPRVGGAAVLSLATVFSATMLAFATDFDSVNVTRVRMGFLPDQKQWVDHAVGDGERVTLINGYGTRTAALLSMFWNRSVDRAALLPDGASVDGFDWPRLEVARDGSLSLDGKPLRGSLLVDSTTAAVDFRDAVVAGRSPTFALWRPPAGREARLSLYALGLVPGASLGSVSALQGWPTRGRALASGYVVFALRADSIRTPVVLRLRLAGGKAQTVNLEPGKRAGVKLPVCARGSWQATLELHSSTTAGAAPVLSSQPIWRDDPTVCTRAA
jgi:hypothetical protein